MRTFSMIRITQLKLRVNEPREKLVSSVRKALRLKEDEAFCITVLRRSIDARKKPDLYEVYTVLVRFENPCTERRILRSHLKNISEYEPVRYRYSLPEDAGFLRARADEAFPVSQHEKEPDRPVIIGTGPAGLFCGLLLAREGLRPILIERGRRVPERSKSVQSFWKGGHLDPDSNVQFGEGGAGTFSDGKLNTGVKDPEGRIRFVLETFVQAGALEEILTDAKPHIGTDMLRNVVSSLSDEITSRGADMFFETCMERITRGDNGTWQVFCSRKKDSERDGDERETIRFSTRNLVLAVGHSARDTFRMLHDGGILMRPKAFAVGVRIQHPQDVIDRAMYGDPFGYSLPAASYKLTHRLSDGRGVYSFCMCPGGYVVNASSEEGCLAVNGMSSHDRASGSANSAIVVTVSPKEILEFTKRNISEKPDAGNGGNTLNDDVLIGVEFQRQLERASFEAGNGSIPVQCFRDFTSSPASCSGLRMPDYEPRIRGRWTPASIRQIFPEKICLGIEEGILAWERQIKGFSSPDAILCACESRTSSPVRIERGEDFQALGHPGLYPCGEGAGYAGGITSAAVDGLKVAEQILKLYK